MKAKTNIRIIKHLIIIIIEIFEKNTAEIALIKVPFRQLDITSFYLFNFDATQEQNISKKPLE